MWDWGLTLDIKNHDDIHESNIYLGEHPSDGKINTYFGVVIPFTLLTMYALPRPAEKGFYKYVNRTTFAIVNMSTEAYCIIDNMSLGLKFRFMF